MIPYRSWCNCHKILGETDGAVLIVNGWEIRRPTTFWCACGCATHWRPVKIRIDAAPVPVYHRRVEA